MTLDLDTFTFKDGKTPLSADEFNARFYALVRRLHALEQLRITWEEVVSETTSYGLQRINEAVQPLVDELRQDMEALLDEGRALLDQLDDHAARQDNPHAVTAAQALYDNAGSGLPGQDLQAAVDILARRVETPNVLLNGSFHLWQRGSALAGNGYLADRWLGVDVTSQARVNDSPLTRFRHAIEFGNDGSALPQIRQRIEGADARWLAQQTVTVSFWGKNLSSTSRLAVQALYPTALDDWRETVSIHSSAVAFDGGPLDEWVYYTWTTALPAEVWQGLEIRIFRVDDDAGAWTRIAGVQLELGSAATPFQGRSYGAELALCQRYYQRSSMYHYMPMVADTSPLARSGSVCLPVAMRTPPSITVTGFNQFDGAPSVVHADRQGFSVSGSAIDADAVASITGYTVDAEL